MAIEATAPSTALIQNDAVVMGLLAATLAFVFWGASRPAGAWKKFYAVVPALLMCYLLPAIYNSFGLIDGNASGLYAMARDYMLPSSLALFPAYQTLQELNGAGRIHPADLWRIDWQLRHSEHKAMARKGLSMTLWLALLLTPLQAFVGDLHGLNVKQHQPVKLAAMEGIWPERESGAPLLLFAIPDRQAEKNHFEIGIPKLASLILTHDMDGELMGLKAVPANERPNVAVVFFSFRIMVGIGLLMILVAVAGAYLRWRGTLYHSRGFLTLCSYLAPSGIIAVLAGWYVVEVGRQPWLVQGLVRTIDVVSPLPPERVLLSLTLFVITYSLLFAVYLYFMRKLIKKGPPSLEQLQQQRIGVKAAGYAVALAKQLKPAQE